MHTRPRGGTSYLGRRRIGRGRQASVTLPEGHRGALQVIAEWEASLAGLNLSEQAAALRMWLQNDHASFTKPASAMQETIAMTLSKAEQRMQRQTLRLACE